MSSHGHNTWYYVHVSSSRDFILLWQHYQYFFFLLLFWHFLHALKPNTWKFSMTPPIQKVIFKPINSHISVLSIQIRQNRLRRDISETINKQKKCNQTMTYANIWQKRNRSRDLHVEYSSPSTGCSDLILNKLLDV